MAVYKDEERGTYYYQTRLSFPDGTKKQSKKRGFRTKKEARVAESLAIEAAKHQVKETPNMKFEDLAREYIEWYSLRRKVSSTMKIKGVLENHLIPKFGDNILKDIRTKNIIDYQSELIGKYSTNHATKIHTVLSATFNHGIKNEYIKDNPARLAGNITGGHKKKMDYWTLDEFREFIRHVDDPLYYCLFMTLYYSGLRKGELLALTWADIDFENNTINVDKTEYYRTITPPKTKASIRKLLMPKFVMVLLTKLKIEKRPELSYVVFGDIKESISTSTLDIRFHKYIKLSGVKRIRIHDFRHSHASYLINKKSIPSVVAKRLGHGDVATTLNTYSHLFPSTEKEAVLSMEDDFKSAKILKMLP